MEIGIFFFVTLTIYNYVHQELPFTGRWKFVYYNDFLHIGSVTSFLCYNSSTDDCQYKVLLGLQNNCLQHDTSKIFTSQNWAYKKKKDASCTDNV